MVLCCFVLCSSGNVLYRDVMVMCRVVLRWCGGVVR